jgi:hypothetical protein
VSGGGEVSGVRSPASPLGRRRVLTAVAAACAGFSAAALVLHAAGLVPIYFAVDLLGAPSLVLLLLCGVYARVVNERVFLSRLVHGPWMGLAATLAYDAVRYPLWAGGLVGFDPFRSHRLFGQLITGHPADGAAALYAGWGYHFWNGIGLGVVYTVIAGPARWWYAVAWAGVLEVLWLLSLPAAVELRLGGEVVAVSLLGHVVYGTVLGLLARRIVPA